jgi:hypothetical protein
MASFSALNDRFLAWAEQVCNTRQHAETGQTPIDRFTSQGPLQPVEPSLLREAFRWSVLRRVTTTAAQTQPGAAASAQQCCHCCAHRRGARHSSMMTAPRTPWLNSRAIDVVQKLTARNVL